MGLKWDVYHLPTGAGFRNHPQHHGIAMLMGWVGNGRASVVQLVALPSTVLRSQALESLTTLWVKVTRFEARHLGSHGPMGPLKKSCFLSGEAKIFRKSSGLHGLTMIKPLVFGCLGASVLGNTNYP